MRGTTMSNGSKNLAYNPSRHNSHTHHKWDIREGNMAEAGVEEEQRLPGHYSTNIQGEEVYSTGSLVSAALQ